MGEIKTLIDSESSEYIENVIKEYVNNRSSRRDRPGRPFENVFYTFEFLSSYGVYRDFHRHRQLTQEAQILTTVWSKSYLAVVKISASLLESFVPY